MESEILINCFVIIIGSIIGIIIGFILFKKNIYKGPDSNKITKEIFIDSVGEYKWIPILCICPINLSMGVLKEPNFIYPGH